MYRHAGNTMARTSTSCMSDGLRFIEYARQAHCCKLCNDSKILFLQINFFNVACMDLSYGVEGCSDAGAPNVIVEVQSQKSFLCAVIVFGICLMIAKSARMRWSTNPKNADSVKSIVAGACELAMQFLDICLLACKRPRMQGLLNPKIQVETKNSFFVYHYPSELFYDCKVFFDAVVGGSQKRLGKKSCGLVALIFLSKYWGFIVQWPSSLERSGRWT